MARRANGEGLVRKRADGRWEARLAWTDSDTGKMRHKSFYGPTATAVRAKLKAARDRLAEGAPVTDATRTVGEWLEQWRTTTLAASNRRPSTRELYAVLSRKHLESGRLAQLRLDRLKPSDVEVLILSLRAETKAGKGEGADPTRKYADATIRQVYTVLRQALDGAVRDGLLAKNPAAAVQRPGIARKEARHLDSVDVSAVLAAARESRHHPALVLIANTGMRRGEALGLCWSAVDLDNGLLRITGTLTRSGKDLVISEPKTTRSRREVPLAAPLVALLRKHRATQKAERLRAANQWHESDLVFTTELGRPVDPRNFLRTIERAAKDAGVEGVGIHTLRHSAATALLDGGAHIKLVSDLLGHSSIAITGDIYGHSSQGAAREALNALAGRLNGTGSDHSSDHSQAQDQENSGRVTKLKSAE